MIFIQANRFNQNKALILLLFTALAAGTFLLTFSPTDLSIFDETNTE